uniref:Uncharacterized protein n=1 Tax=Oryza sativa subsp. japonica TaxID=39947 RepID=Q6ZDU1_ORYSJ|nr:hypothetical protein [Oryza sativa Japonica Group]
MQSEGKLPSPPAVWLYSLGLLPHLKSRRSGRGTSGCHVVSLGPSRCLVPRPSPNCHVEGGASGEGTQAEQPSMRGAPTIPHRI